MPTRDLVLGLDSSTTACKAVIWDLHGRPLCSGSSPISVWMPHPGWHEQPASDWWSAAVSAIRQSAASIDLARLAGLAIAHQRESFVPLDEGGRPLTNAILWMDERARSNLPALRAQLGEQAFHQSTGKPLSVNLAVGKIAWLRENQPDIFARTAIYADTLAYLHFRLTGHFSTGWGSADPLGLFDMPHHRWHVGVLHALDLREDQLPRLLAPAENAGRLCASAARETGLPEGLPILVGLGDGQAGSLGLGITGAGQASLSLGTSVVGGYFSPSYLNGRAFRTTTGGVPGTYLLETTLLGGTYTLKWLFETLLKLPSQDQIQTYAQYDQAAAQLPPGSEGLLLVPYWNSVLNPYWDAGASGIVAGWRGIHGPAHLYRAVLEGIAFEVRLHLEGIETALAAPVQQLVAAGGGARSSLWLQILADITGKPVYRSTTREAAALGAGILAATGCGLYPNVAQAANAMSQTLDQPFLPDEQCSQLYTRLYDEVYRQLYPALQNPLNHLADILDHYATFHD